eukprot:snap_masked-scaffold_2-processed-gene-21.10-mRNA-1 protein AED:1.00 eAED:1.00 QI:0/-1/0/0/-1/1/1/0/205
MAIKQKKNFPSLTEVLTVKDNQYRTTLQLACLSGSYLLTSHLLKTLNSMNLLTKEFLLNVDVRGSSAFHAAVRFGHLKIVVLFLKSQYHSIQLCVPDLINQETATGAQPLTLAIRNYHLQICHLLLSNPHTILSKLDMNCRSCLTEAASSGLEELFVALVKALLLRDGKGTALHIFTEAVVNLRTPLSRDKINEVYFLITSFKEK